MWAFDTFLFVMITVWEKCIVAETHANPFAVTAGHITVAVATDKTPDVGG